MKAYVLTYKSRNDSGGGQFYVRHIIEDAKNADVDLLLLTSGYGGNLATREFYCHFLIKNENDGIMTRMFTSVEGKFSLTECEWKDIDETLPEEEKLVIYFKQVDEIICDMASKMIS